MSQTSHMEHWTTPFWVSHYRAEVCVILSEEVELLAMQWCDKNIGEREKGWDCIYSSESPQGKAVVSRFFFSNDTDAVAFTLLWGEDE